MTTAQKKDSLQFFLKTASDEKIEKLYDILQYGNHSNFENMVKVIGYTEEERRQIDKNYPQDLGKAIVEVYPEFYRGNYCFDYNKKSFGELVNLNNKFVYKLIEVFSKW